MPVIPSFSGFASTPDLGGSFLGGARIAADLAQNAQRLSLQRQQLAQSAAQAEMEFQSKEAAQRRSELVGQQNREIEKAYNQSRLGMAERELQMGESKLMMDAMEASQKFSSQQNYKKRFAELEPKMGAQAAAQQAMMEIGPSGLGFSQAMKAPAPRNLTVPDVLNQGNDRFFRVEEGGPWKPFAPSFDDKLLANNLVQSQQAEAGRQSQQSEWNRQYDVRWTGDKIKELRESMGKLTLAPANAQLVEKMTPKEKSKWRAKNTLEAGQLDEYLDKKKKIAELEGELRGFLSGPSSKATLPGAMTGTNAPSQRFTFDRKAGRLVPSQ